MKGTLSEAKPTDEAFGRVTSCFSFTIKCGEHYMKCALRKLAAKEKGIKNGVTTGVTPFFLPGLNLWEKPMIVITAAQP